MVIGVRLPWQTPILPRWQRCEVRVAALLRRCSYQPGERLWSGQEVVSDRGAEFHGGVRVTNFAGCWTHSGVKVCDLESCMTMPP